MNSFIHHIANVTVSCLSKAGVASDQQRRNLLLVLPLRRTHRGRACSMCFDRLWPIAQTAV